jgi:hypothetical protein
MELLRRTGEQLLTVKRAHRFVMVLMSCLVGSASNYAQDHSHLPVTCNDPAIFSPDMEFAACQTGNDIFITRQDGQWKKVRGELVSVSDEGVNFQQHNGDSIDKCSIDRNFKLTVKHRRHFR